MIARNAPNPIKARGDNKGFAIKTYNPYDKTKDMPATTMETKKESILFCADILTDLAIKKHKANEIPVFHIILRSWLMSKAYSLILPSTPGIRFGIENNVIDVYAPSL